MPRRVALAMRATIEIIGPDRAGIYVVKFRAPDGRGLAFFVPGSDAAVLRAVQERMPYGVALWDPADAPAEDESTPPADCERPPRRHARPQRTRWRPWPPKLFS